MDLINIAQCDYIFFEAAVHQPSITELAEIFKEEEDLISLLKLIIFPLNSLLNLNGELSEFQIFLGILFSNPELFGLTPDKKIKFFQFIQLCFKDYSLELLKESFILKKKDDENNFIVIDDSNFNDFKLTLKTMFDIPEIFGEQEKKYNPKNARAARIAKTLEEGNKKTMELNGIKHTKGIIENYITILSIGLKIPPSVLCRELTLYNLFNLYRKFIAKTSWDLDIDCRLAGGSPKDSPENWMSLT